MSSCGTPSRSGACTTAAARRMGWGKQGPAHLRQHSLKLGVVVLQLVGDAVELGVNVINDGVLLVQLLLQARRWQ